MALQHWIQQRNLYENLAAGYEDRGEPVPRHIREQLRLIRGAIKAHKTLI